MTIQEIQTGETELRVSPTALYEFGLETIGSSSLPEKDRVTARGILWHATSAVRAELAAELHGNGRWADLERAEARNARDRMGELATSASLYALTVLPEEVRIMIGFEPDALAG